MKKDNDFYHRQLEHQKEIFQYRTLKSILSRDKQSIECQGKTLFNFGSNDYLGLSQNTCLHNALIEGVRQWGLGSAGSRLVTGNLGIHDAFEQKLAEFSGKQRALVFPSGFQSNLAVISTLVQKDDVIFIDKLNHASLIDGARHSGARLRIFPHKDYDYLEKIISKVNLSTRKWIITDTVFSMDGDCADMVRLAQIKHSFNAFLVVDEAHAVGVLGEQGQGLCQTTHTRDDVDLILGTLSKSFGLQGGYVCGSGDWIPYLINFSRPFLFSTGILPAIACAAFKALDLIKHADRERSHLLHLQKQSLTFLKENHCDTGKSTSQIIPVIVHSSEKAVSAERHMRESGYMIPAIRYPTVKKGFERLRLSLTADMEWSKVHEGLCVLVQFLKH